MSSDQRIRNKYAASGLVPLPYESSIAGLWRFQWRNALSASALQEICSKRRGNLLFPHFISDAADTAHFETLTGLHLPSEEENRFLAFRIDELLSPFLRYCPLCLELGYHSFIQQFEGIPTCPWHNVELTTKCHCCDARLPAIRMPKDIFHSPYKCSRCGAPYCGVEPSLQLDELLRMQAAEVERYFGPIYRWWLDAESTRETALTLLPYSGERHSLSNLNSAHLQALAHGFVLHSSPRPFPIAEPFCQNLRCLTWQHQKYTCFEPLSSQMRPQRDAAEVKDLFNYAYRTALFAIEQWVMNDAGLTHDELLLEMDLPREFVSEYKESVIALVCFRAQFENRPVSASDLCPTYASVKYVPDTGAPDFYADTSWAAYVSFYFLSQYSSWWMKIRQAQRTPVSSIGYFETRELDRKCEHIFGPEKEGIIHNSSGFFILPDIPSFLEFFLEYLHCPTVELSCQLIDLNHRFHPSRWYLEERRSLMAHPLMHDEISKLSPKIERFIALKTSIEGFHSVEEVKTEVNRFLQWCSGVFAADPYCISADELNEYPSFLVCGFRSSAGYSSNGVCQKEFEERIKRIYKKTSLSIGSIIGVINQFLEMDFGLWGGRSLRKMIVSPLLSGREFSLKDVKQYLLSCMSPGEDLIEEVHDAALISLAIDTQWSLSSLLQIRAGDFSDEIFSATPGERLGSRSVWDPVLCRYCSLSAESVELITNLMSMRNRRFTQPDRLIFSRRSIGSRPNLYKKRKSIETRISDKLPGGAIWERGSSSAKTEKFTVLTLRHVQNQSVTVKFIFPDSRPLTLLIGADMSLSFFR